MFNPNYFSETKANFKQRISGKRLFIMAGDLAFIVTRKSVMTTLKNAYWVSGFTMTEKPDCLWITKAEKIETTH